MNRNQKSVRSTFIVTRSRDHDVIFLGPPIHDTNCSHFTENIPKIEVKIFKRCIYKSIAFHSALYKRPKRTNNTFVLLRSEKCAKILKFTSINEEFYVEIVELEIQKNPTGAFNLMHLAKVQSESVLHRTVSGHEISEKCIIINFKNEVYVSHMPNTTEIQ